MNHLVILRVGLSGLSLLLALAGCGCLLSSLGGHAPESSPPESPQRASPPRRREHGPNMPDAPELVGRAIGPVFAILFVIILIAYFKVYNAPPTAQAPSRDIWWEIVTRTQGWDLDQLFFAAIFIVLAVALGIMSLGLFTVPLMIGAWGLEPLGALVGDTLAGGRAARRRAVFGLLLLAAAGLTFLHAIRIDPAMAADDSGQAWATRILFALEGEVAHWFDPEEDTPPPPDGSRLMDVVASPPLSTGRLLLWAGGALLLIAAAAEQRPAKLVKYTLFAVGYLPLTVVTTILSALWAVGIPAFVAGYVQFGLDIIFATQIEGIVLDITLPTWPVAVGFLMGFVTPLGLLLEDEEEDQPAAAQPVLSSRLRRFAAAAPLQHALFTLGAAAFLCGAGIEFARLLVA